MLMARVLPVSMASSRDRTKSLLRRCMGMEAQESQTSSSSKYLCLHQGLRHHLMQLKRKKISLAVLWWLSRRSSW